MLAEHVTVERFPLATRIGAAAGEHHGAARDDEHAFRFGLARILDGIGSLADSSAPPAAAASDVGTE